MRLALGTDQKKSPARQRRALGCHWPSREEGRRIEWLQHARGRSAPQPVPEGTKGEELPVRKVTAKQQPETRMVQCGRHDNAQFCKLPMQKMHAYVICKRVV
jgi:hypothetical protein